MKKKQKFGFTLAETLITLVIVGVVAALTVPNLIVKYQKEQTVTRLKKAYSILAQAIELSKLSNGHHSTWDYELNGSQFFEKYLTSFIKLSQEQITSPRTQNVTYYNLDGQVSSILYVTGNGTIYMLNSGIQFLLENYNFALPYKLIYIDINGFKKPNKIGRDIFTFAISKKYGVIPYKYYNKEDKMANTREELMSSTIGACNNKQIGLWCAALIMLDGWKIADDYPW